MLQHALVHFGASFHPKTKGEFNRIFKERVEFVLAADTQPAGPPLLMLPAANITFQGDFTVNTKVDSLCSARVHDLTHLQSSPPQQQHNGQLVVAKAPSTHGSTEPRLEPESVSSLLVMDYR